MLKSYAVVTKLNSGRFFVKHINATDVEKVKDRIDAELLARGATTDGRHVIIAEKGQEDKYSKVYLDGAAYSYWVKI